jgi:hypothetical protein
MELELELELKRNHFMIFFRLKIPKRKGEERTATFSEAGSDVDHESSSCIQQRRHNLTCFGGHVVCGGEERKKSAFTVPALEIPALEIPALITIDLGLRDHKSVVQ